MEAAKNSLERILEAAGKLSDRKDNAAAENITEEELALLKEAEGFVTKFEAAMDDDFNTADALAAIFELVKFANTNVNENSSKEFAAGLYEELFKLSDVLGLKIEKKEEILDKEIEDLIQERQAARKAKDFKRADEIRDELLKKGIFERYKRRCEMAESLRELKELFDLKDADLRTYSPLTLAYIGDGVYELVIRTILVKRANCPVNRLHKKASSLVKASAQSGMMEIIEPLLTEDEKSVYRRGRNAHSATMANMRPWQITGVPQVLRR